MREEEERSEGRRGVRREERSEERRGEERRGEKERRRGEERQGEERECWGNRSQGCAVWPGLTRALINTDTPAGLRPLCAPLG